jgi:hypothetical protein
MTFSRDLFKRSKARFKTWGRRKQFAKQRPPALNVASRDQDERYLRFLREIGNVQIAKKCWDLFQKHPRATLPELIAMEWLIRHNYRHIFQVYAFGGRRRGGAVPDFMVFMPAGGLILMIQGEYWHGSTEQKAEDARIKLMLLGQKAEGVTVYKVIEVWEDDLYQGKADRTMAMALQGISVRG